MLLCRYLKNGWSISTVAPNKGLATQLKKLIIQTSTKVNGESLDAPCMLSLTWVTLYPLRQPQKYLLRQPCHAAMF